jgi:uncharacterized Zn ribbon protein
MYVENAIEECVQGLVLKMEIICPRCNSKIEESDVVDNKCPECGFDFNDAEIEDDVESAFMFDQAGLSLFGGL